MSRTDKYLGKLQKAAIELMRNHYHSEYKVGYFMGIMDGYEVELLDVDRNHPKDNLLCDMGDFQKEIGRILYEQDIDIFDWSIREKVIHPDEGGTNHIIRVQFYELAR
jgi:hypothetical protein